MLLVVEVWRKELLRLSPALAHRGFVSSSLREVVLVVIHHGHVNGANDRCRLQLHKHRSRLDTFPRRIVGTARGGGVMMGSSIVATALRLVERVVDLSVRRLRRHRLQ
jgi:hypothetical protein